ncbi:DFP-domain-containing protein [Ramicandelaber brevisporus]|nr:DFP-domain-containing protein [Ramicandelaber brevisporus]
MPAASSSASARVVVDPETYFEQNKPPKNLPWAEQQLSAFIAKHAAVKGRRMVLITSGGTAVPLENQTVRFVDNFSAGTRGASSAEHFLEYDSHDNKEEDVSYAVVFLHRERSLQPYSRHYPHTGHCFLNYVRVEESTGSLLIDESEAAKMRAVVTKYHKAMDNGRLLSIPFHTLSDYLFLLRAATTAIAPTFGPRSLFYLAAAVSDFFIPAPRMAEHKIQSSAGGLTLTMDQVPKFLGPLVHKWAGDGFIVSFKLETDPDMLVPKARQALLKYGHHLVIGNLLQTRKNSVSLISRRSFPMHTPATSPGGSPRHSPKPSQGNIPSSLTSTSVVAATGAVDASVPTSSRSYDASLADAPRAVSPAVAALPGLQDSRISDDSQWATSHIVLGNKEIEQTRRNHNKSDGEGEDDREIEFFIIHELVERHSTFLHGRQPPSPSE